MTILNERMNLKKWYQQPNNSIKISLSRTSSREKGNQGIWKSLSEHRWHEQSKVRFQASRQRIILVINGGGMTGSHMEEKDLHLTSDQKKKEELNICMCMCL